MRLKRELDAETEAANRILSERVDLLRKKGVDELTVLLGHWEEQVKRHRKLDTGSIQKRRDAELWTRSISYLLEHPEILAEKPTTPTSEIPASTVRGLNVAQPENMTPDEAAMYLRIPRSSLYKGTSKGEIPHRKVGKLLRFSQKELDEYLLSRKVMSKEERDHVAETKLTELRKRRKT
jgi:excisionase family DNA binding protein